jgi:hypothetical protein
MGLPRVGSGRFCLRLRQTFVDAGTQVQSDLKAFRDAVACPQDAPS